MLRNSYFADVGIFHKRFGLPTYADGRKPQLLDHDTLRYRTNFMQEELDEFVKATADKSLADAADALADLVYVALGTAHLMGVPFEEIWTEVQRANMTKVRAVSADDPLSKRKHHLDVVKPADFVPPDHAPALEAAGRYADMWSKR
jgi:predicted HAD superfamily Cof-like phosphohydrolase